MSNIRVAEFDVRAVATSPTPEDLALISGPAFAGRQVSADEVIVRRMRLAHDRHDRTGERFSRDILERFAETAPGRSVLMGHNTGNAPVGMFFRADVRSRQERAFPVIVGGTEDDGWARRFRWENQDQRVTWLEPDFYAPAGTEMARNIDLGVWKWVSIGFQYDDLVCDVCHKSYWSGDCPHIIGRVTDDGKVVTASYGGDVAIYEMLEGSIVFLGAQQQARLVKQLRDGAVDVEALCFTAWGEDLVLRKEAEFLARRYGHRQKMWAFPHFRHASKSSVQRPSGNPDAPCEGCLSTDCAGCAVFEALTGANSDTGSVGPADSNSEPAVAGAQAAVAATDTTSERSGNMAMTPEEKAAYDAAQKRATDAEAAVAAAEQRAKDAETAKATAEEANATLAVREPLAAIGEEALKQVHTELCDHYVRLERGPEFAELAGLLMERRDYAKLVSLRDAAFAEVCQRFPAAPLGKPEEQPADTDEAPAVRRPYRRQDAQLV